MPVMPKETSDTTKPKTPRTRRQKAAVSESKAVLETPVETAPKSRRRATKQRAAKKAEVVEAETEEVTEAPARKAPTTIKADATQTRSGIKISRHWYAMAFLALMAFGGAAYIGYQDSGAIDVDTLMAERRRALNEERAARSVPVQNQAAVVSALEGDEEGEEEVSDEDGSTEVDTEAEVESDEESLELETQAEAEVVDEAVGEMVAD